MKTARELIERIRVWEANVRQIADSRIINGSLLIDIETAMIDYATEAIKADRERVAENVKMVYHCGHTKKTILLFIINRVLTTYKSTKNLF